VNGVYGDGLVGGACVRNHVTGSAEDDGGVSGLWVFGMDVDWERIGGSG